MTTSSEIKYIEFDDPKINGSVVENAKLKIMMKEK